MDKEKRYCKGCFLDVTYTMWCSCGEFYLNESSTYVEKDMREPPNYKSVRYWIFVASEFIGSIKRKLDTLTNYLQGLHRKV